MALELKQNLTLTQQLVLTPQLQQSIKLLQLSKIELIEFINKELLENPVIEDTIESENIDGTEISEGDHLQTDIAEKKDREPNIDWESYFTNYDEKSERFYQKENQGENVSFEAFLTRKVSLHDHLMWQLKLSDFSKEEEKIAEYIIGNINEDGYLIEDVDNISKIFNSPKELVENVRNRIRNFDPAGVASLNLQEALISQVELIEGDIKHLLKEILSHNIKELEKRDYKALAKKLKVPLESVCEMVKIISMLDPKPGNAYSSELVQYILPDLYLYKIDNQYIVVMDESGIPNLRISSYYKDIMLNKNEHNIAGRQYILEKMKSAAWFIKSIEQRKRTVIKVMESILKFQRKFFDNGVEYLRPLTLKDIAEDIGVHESTVSRVTTNKYVHTPRGLFELKYFFNSGVNSFTGGEMLASEVVKEEIKKLLLSENPKNPHSDQDISELLKKKNIKIARRTITKYREMLNIPSSSHRKKIF